MTPPPPSQSMGAPQMMQDPHMMRLFEQFLQGMQAPSGPNPGSATTQQPMGAPRPAKAVGPSAPPTNAGHRQTQPEPTAMKSFAAELGWE